LGGDSVISLQVVSRCRQAGLELTPKQIFERQTIAELATLVVTSTRRADQSAITGPVLLTPIQRWFVEQDFPDADYFNQAVLLELPLFRAVLFDSGRGIPSRLLLAAHHLAVDLISWRILIEDLQTACEQISRGQAIRLPAKTDSFKHWAEQLNAHAASSSFDH